MDIEWKEFGLGPDNFAIGIFWVSMVSINSDGVIIYEDFDVAVPNTAVLMLACVNGKDDRTYFVLTDLERWTLADKPNAHLDNFTSIDPKYTCDAQLRLDVANKTFTVLDLNYIKSKISWKDVE